MTSKTTSHWPDGQGGLRLSFAKPSDPIYHRTSEPSEETLTRWPADEPVVLTPIVLTPAFLRWLRGAAGLPVGR